MSRRKYNREGQIPHNLDEMINIKYVANGGKCSMDSVLTYMHSRSWFSNTEEWYHFLDDKLSDWIYNNYKLRPFKYDLVNMFESPFDNYCYLYTTPSSAEWRFTHFGNDYEYLETQISNICQNVFLSNQEKYKKLYDAMTLEFNPLWNVDGTETTTRTLEKDGTISSAKDGYDELANTGHDDVTHGGKDTTTKSGGFDVTKTGTATVRRLGDDATTFSGKESNTKSGNDVHKTQGGETKTHREITTDAPSFLDVTQDYTTYGSETETGGDIENSLIETNVYNDVKDEKTFTNRQDSVHHDVTDTTNYNNVKDATSYNNYKDETAFGQTVKNEYLSKHKTTYDIDDVQTFDTIDTERITLERHGNIGVTTTTKLLSELVDYSQYFNYVDIVAKDLINAICEGVY